MSGYESSLELKAPRMLELEVETDDAASRPTSPTIATSASSSEYSGYFGGRTSLPFKRDSLTPKTPLEPPASPPPPPQQQEEEEAQQQHDVAEAAYLEPSVRPPIVPPLLSLEREGSLNSTPSSSPRLQNKFSEEPVLSEGNLNHNSPIQEVAPSPKSTPTLKRKKSMAPQPPSATLPPPPSKEAVIAANAPSPGVQDANDPSLDIERPRPGVANNNNTLNKNESRNSTMGRDQQIYYNDVDTEFQFDTISRVSSEASVVSGAKQLRFRKVTFKEFTQRGFLVPTWYVGYLQMTIGIATAILAMVEILLPTGSDTEYGSSRWFTLKKFNIYGFSFISSLALTIAGCYLVRAQTKNDLHVIKSSAGYAALSTFLHIGAFTARLIYLWLGKIAPSTIGFHMYVASLCIIILTIFGFWVSALGFGVYALFVHNHTQAVGTVENLRNESGPVLDLLDRYMGIAQ